MGGKLKIFFENNFRRGSQNRKVPKKKLWAKKMKIGLIKNAIESLFKRCPPPKFADVTPLWAAVVFVNLELCRALIAHGANIEMGTDSGHSPLLCACFNGNLEIGESISSGCRFAAA